MVYRRALTVVLVLVTLSSILPAWPVPPARARETASVAPIDGRVGVHLMLGDGRKKWPRAVWDEHLAYAANLVGEGGYVVQMLQGDQMHPGRWQAFLDATGESGLRPIVRIATTFDHRKRRWRAPYPDDNGVTYERLATRYARFLDRLRWPAGERYVVVGNEPNRGDEWGNAPDPAAYVRFLGAMADALRARGFRVLNAPLDTFCPNTNGGLVDGVRYVDAESFLDGMLAVDPRFFDRLDGWASHSYPLGPFVEPPERQEFRIDYLNGATNPSHRPPPPGVYNRGVNAYAWDLWKLAAAGLDRPLPVFITETGWRHAEAERESGNDAAGAVLTSDEVAERTIRALVGPPDPARGFTPLLADPRVAAVIFFALDGDPDYWSHTNWLRLDSRGRVTGTYPQYDRVREVLVSQAR